MKKNYHVLLMLIFALATQLTFAQNGIITGTVTDAETGEPLPGVNVAIKGTQAGTSTDFDGHYKIKAQKGQTLVFSFIGYQNTSKKVGDKKVINVSLREAQEMLKAVTINALGVEVKKSSQKGIAISNVKAKTLLTSGESDPVAALSGKVSGVNINLASGDPGASTNITIRGPKSIILSNKPLFVVDGVPVVDDIYGSGVAGVERPSKIADIDPNNIASIKILKGGSAAALWGSKGANGVVIITTKKGKSAKKGQINVTITSSYGIDNALTKFPLQDTFGQGKEGKYPLPGQFFDKSGSWGDKISERSGAPDLTSYIPNDEANSLYFEDQDGNKWGMVFQKNSTKTYNKKNYDAVIGAGTTLRNSIQLSTATDKARYFLGFNHLDQTGIFAQSYYKKIGVNFNTIISPTKKLKIKTNIQYANTKQNAIQKGSNLSGLLLGLYRTPADFDNSGYYGERHEYGSISKFSHRSYRAPVGTFYKGNPGYSNPLFTVNKQKNPYYSNHIIAGTNFGYQVNEWLKLIAKAGVDYAGEQADSYFPTSSGEEPKGSYSTYIYNSLQLSGDLIAQINTEIVKDLTLDMMIGTNWFHREYDYDWVYYYDFLLPIENSNAGNATPDKRYPGIGGYVKRKNSGYGTATLTYKDLAYLTLTERAERSSGYYGLISYPSVSLAFDVANLKYFKDKDSNLLNQLTLRTNWSKVGNEPSGTYFLTTYYVNASDRDGYASYWSAGGYGGAFWRSPRNGNPKLKPEITTEIEFGADVKMFNRRLSLNLSYYDSKSEDLILPVSVPAATGFTKRWSNVASMTNKGFELEASYVTISKPNINLTFGGTFTQNKNKVVHIEGSKYIPLDGFISTSSGVAEGYGYGILRSGDFKRDNNGYVLDDNGFPVKGDKEFAGDPNADFKASIYTNLRYKKFKFKVLVDGSFGGKSWDGTYGALTYFGRTLETANEVTVDGSMVNSKGETVQSLVFSQKIWGVNNGDGTYTVRGNVKDFGAGEVLLDEIWYTGIGGGFGPVGTQFFRDATWIKLREVSAGYTFKGKTFGVSKIKSIYFGVTGRNLYLWTKDKNWHIDPESNLSGSSRGRGLQYFNHPTTKSFIFTTIINF